MTERFRRVLQVLLHVEDTPHRTALAFGVGIFIAFSPFLGIHMGIALVVAFAFNLNRVAILLGTYVNNPWTLVPMYLGGTTLGCLLLDVPNRGVEIIDWSQHGMAFLVSLWTSFRPYLWPFLLGNTILGLVCGTLGYLLLRHVLERRAATGSAAPAPQR